MNQIDPTDTENLIDLFRIIFRRIYLAQEELETIKYLLEKIPDTEDEVCALKVCVDGYQDFYTMLLETRDNLVGIEVIFGEGEE